MKKFTITFGIVMLFVSLLAGNCLAAIQDIRDDVDDVNIIIDSGDPPPISLTPPPTEAIEVLVENGFITKVEEKELWDLYYSALSSPSTGDECAICSLFRLAYRIIEKAAKLAGELMVVNEAMDALHEWVDPFRDSCGGATVPGSVLSPNMAQ